MTSCENVTRMVRNCKLLILMIGGCHNVSRILMDLIYVMASVVIGYQIGGKLECSYWLGGSRVGSSVVNG